METVLGLGSCGHHEKAGAAAVSWAGAGPELADAACLKRVLQAQREEREAGIRRWREVAAQRERAWASRCAASGVRGVREGMVIAGAARECAGLGAGTGALDASGVGGIGGDDELSGGGGSGQEVWASGELVGMVDRLLQACGDGSS